ncbi:tetratricopeptide repeat protein [Aeoliella sp. SH292]|uniref:tetratricopeptide repeat protein n=1 Tax=Aeoliella sp. SH292 TaxID=3454464 RepID=UPI003F94751D
MSIPRTALLFWVFLIAPVCVPGTSLASGTLKRLYDELANRRATHIARLHEYAARGDFPLNKDFPGQLVPYFVDEAGIACAVGHLMRLDGEAPLVASIASTTNHVRIADVDQGPLIEWIGNSGLTKEECALIQPSYATIEDYRRGQPWQDEIARLRKHFAEVERELVSETQQSLRKALIADVDARLAANANDAALAFDALTQEIGSDEPSVRMAAAYAIARLANPSRSARLAALLPNLSDSDREVRFWTAVAVQETGAESPRGKAELYNLTLPIFLEAFKSSDTELRLAALSQLANTAPITMGTHRQLRIMPEIRQAMVESCEDKDGEISQFARSVLKSWRWQRVAYESQRIRRQYLAESAELEALATETLALGREFAEQPNAIRNLVDLRSIYDTASSTIYLLPVATETTLPITDSPTDAEQIVNNYFVATYERYRGQTKSPWPFWEIASTDTNGQELYFIVFAKRTDTKPSSDLIYLLPRPAMLAKASSLPYYWFKREAYPVEDARAGRQQNTTYHPNENSEVVLGNLARNNRVAFTTTCDFFAYFLTHHSQIVIDREIVESPDTLVWTGQFALFRAHNPRFFGEGVGSSTYGGGGWDFHQFSFSCNRTTGRLTFSAKPIEFPIAQLPSNVLSPEWVTQEHRLMGWRPIESLDFFGNRLLPPEYHDAIDAFKPHDASEARSILYRRHVAERCLPHPGLVLGLLYEQAGDRESAVRSMQQAAGSNRHDPDILADVARWETTVGLHDDARKHAEAAMALWPEHPGAKQMVRQLDVSVRGK